MARSGRKTYIGLAVFSTLLNLILLWSAEALGGWGVLLLPLCLLPTEILCLEQRYGAYLLSIVVPASMILLLPFPHYAWFGFVTVVGWYPLIRTALFELKSTVLQSLLALLFCCIGTAVGCLGLLLIGANPVRELDPFWLTLLLTGMLIGFALLDAVCQLFRKLYLDRLRRFLLV